MQDDLLTQILTKNYAEKEFSVAQGRIKLTLRTLTAKEQLSIEEQVGQIKDQSNLYVLHQYSMQTLKRCLVRYNDKDLTILSDEQKDEFLGGLSSGLVDILTKYRDDLQKEVFKLLVPEDLEAHFFPKNESGAGSNLSSKDSTSTNTTTPPQSS